MAPTYPDAQSNEGCTHGQARSSQGGVAEPRRGNGGGPRGEPNPESAVAARDRILPPPPFPSADAMLEFESEQNLKAVIKVFGIGGGGGNALNTMIEAGLSGVEFIAANTDAQALHHSKAHLSLQLGAEVTRGLGCGANPDKGRQAALEVRDRLRDHLLGTDMVFVTAGLGGGTGTGAAPIIAEIAREVGALTVAVVTKPFAFEGRVRQRHAEAGLEELHRVVDTLIAIPNQRLLALAGRNTPVQAAFKLADDVLLGAVKGISDLITVHGLINLDFADVRTIMDEMGMALMGSGVGRGENRALEAARFAISSPLLEELSIDGARGVLINITGGSDLTLYEVNEAATLVQDSSHDDANIIFGAVIDEGMDAEEVRVTVIATGLDNEPSDGRSCDDDAVARFANVTPLRRDIGAGRETVPSRGAAPSAGARGDERSDFLSPFEDELDVPTFLRRKSSEEEEDRESPAFERRSAD